MRKYCNLVFTKIRRNLKLNEPRVLPTTEIMTSDLEPFGNCINFSEMRCVMLYARLVIRYHESNFCSRNFTISVSVILQKIK